ncbi:MAG TPA: tripartite tricarboxylate transporter substrate binding protein [Ramlibacter sp.]|nr:tripartite tricarboxylate transporter substrate binding protein [Ramlibacter sp.]
MNSLKTSRRTFVAAAAALPFGFAAAQASYPSGPIRIVVPYPAGGATDTLARLIAQEVQTAWGGSVIVENKPGASGNIGGQLVAKAPPDGHTVLMGITALAQLPAMMAKMPFDPLKDLVPVIEVARSNSFLVVPADSLAANFRQFVAITKASPRRYSYGSYGNGTSAHIQGELLKMQAGLDIQHIPYKGSAPLIVDLIGGQVTAGFVDAATLAPHLKTGKVRVLAATGSQRSRLLPEVPTFAELGFKDFESYGWFGMFMPAGTPPAVVMKFSDEAARILKQPQHKARVEGLGLTPVGNKPQEFARTVRGDSALYAKIIKAAHITMD